MSIRVASAHGLFKSYNQAGTKIDVLKGLNLTVDQGETIAIVGQSGSGKSTFLTLMAGLDLPDSGIVELEGTNITSMDEKSLTHYRARHLSIVFQQFHLMPYLTALENVTLPLEILGQRPAAKTTNDLAYEALTRVGLGSRINHLPHQLSGGEKQRVAIARAIVVKPSLLLADEPSGNLDQKTGDTVMNLLFDQVSSLKMSLILVTHNESLAARCHKKLILEDGVLR